MARSGLADAYMHEKVALAHREKRKLLCSRPPARPGSLSASARQGVLARPTDSKPLR
jgi:hypothetical protein